MSTKKKLIISEHLISLLPMKRLILGLLALALVVVGVGQVQADVITSLFNTGVDASGTPLPDATIGDPHYALVSIPNGVTDTRVRTSAGGYPIPPYFGDNLISTWIGPNNDGKIDGPVGLYDYQTTFNLTGFVPSTATITGGWSSDNNGVKILLNGVDTGNPGTLFDQFAHGFVSFSITSGFVLGINTLDFIVNNGQLSPGDNTWNPTSLRVEVTGTADPVPEPATMLLLGSGLLGLAGYGRRRFLKK